VVVPSCRNLEEHPPIEDTFLDSGRQFGEREAYRIRQWIPKKSLFPSNAPFSFIFHSFFFKFQSGLSLLIPLNLSLVDSNDNKQ